MVTKINTKPLIRKESLVFSKEIPQGELEVRKFKDGTYHVTVNNEEHAWFDEDDLTSLKYYLKYKKDIPEDEIILKEDTVQKANGKWTNRGDDGTEHGEFDTKKEADAQRKAMFASGYKGESLDEKLNLTSEGKALKRAIKNIVVDNDDELREFVSAIVEEVISERSSLEESVDDPEEFKVGDHVAFDGRSEENREVVTGIGDVIQKDGRIYKVKVSDERINTKKGQVVTIDGMYLQDPSYFD